MPEPIETFALLPGVLDDQDLTALRRVCREHFRHETPMAGYLLIDQSDSPVYGKVKAAIEAITNERMYYLNDFYIYTDATSQANWHMDTEFFTFESCLNAWVLLSPEEVDSPLSCIGDLNGAPGSYFHSIDIKDDEGTFTNYHTCEQEVRALAAIEAAKIEAPKVRAGDILVFNPKKFHKTNVTTPKHALSIKFVIEGENGFRSAMQLPEILWAETKLYNTAMKNAQRWDDVLDEIRKKLETPEGREILNAGFFPERMRLYKEMVERL